MQQERIWTGSWIAGNNNGIDTGRENGRDRKRCISPAPYIRKCFDLEQADVQAVLYLASAGWHELYINGKKADDRVLAPCITQFNKHINYIEYDISMLLRQGRNAITVLLGNGGFNAQPNDVWNFNHASWRDYPRMCCDLEIDGKTFLYSDNTWKVNTGALIFDSMRSGETWDCAKDINGVFEADFDDTGWQNAFIVRPPAGTPLHEEMEPCKICENALPVNTRQTDPCTLVYDFGKNFTGWAAVEIEPMRELPDSVEIKLEFGEKLNPDGTVDMTEISKFLVDGWETQTCRIILAPGSGKISWRPHFTYFGFRYMQITCSNLQDIAITKAEALFIHNDFTTAGAFTCSSSVLNKLQTICRRSMLANYTGIPTDCPHREKNGWTGDQTIAMTAILWNFHALEAYKNFMQIITDAQRPSGELPCIAPTADWWWLCGPSWDGVLFEAAWNTYLFYGDDTIIREHYEAMRRYLHFAGQLKINGLVEYGLPDWCHPEMAGGANFAAMAPVRLTSSAVLYSLLERFCVFARMTGHEEDIPQTAAFAAELKENIRREFLISDSSGNCYVNCPGKETAAACFLYFNLCTADESKAMAAFLAALMRARQHKAYFGIYGSKWIPRVLADYGYADDAAAILLQTDYPGYGNIITAGATTLWETWNGDSSLNHVMFADPSAWFFEYLAGIRPQFTGGGFKEVVFSPCPVSQLNDAGAEYTLADGRKIYANWRRDKGNIIYTIDLPAGISAKLEFNGTSRPVPAGKSVFILNNM